MAIDISVAQTRDGYRVVLQAQSASRRAERTVSLPTCAEAQKAAALLVALTLDPEAAEVKPLPDAAPSPPPEQVAPPAPPAEAPRAPPPAPPVQPASTEPSPALGLELSLHAVLEPALLPEPTGGLAAGAGVRLGRYALAATGLYLLGREVDAPDHPTARAEARLWTAGLSLCRFHALGRAVELAPCLAAELGDFAAKAEGVARRRRDSALFATIDAGVLLAVSVGRGFAVLAGVAGLVPLQRPVMEFRDIGPVHTVPAWSIRGSVGVRFGTPGG
jgi:hypothetical protein